MMKKSLIPLAAAVLALVAPLQVAFAQSSMESAEPEGQSGGLGSLAVGLGVGVESRPYEGADRKVRALPFLLYENRYVRVAGPGLDLKLPSAGPVSFALAARYFNGAYEEGDAPILQGMGDRKGGVWLGGSVRWREPGLFELSAELLKDASNHSDGLQGRLALSKDFRTGHFMFTPTAALNWQDKKLVDYNYGVNAGEALPGRPEYEGKSTVNLDLSLRSSYLLAPHHMLMLEVGGTHLGSGVTDSPLVGRENIARARFGYLYRF